MIAGAVLDNLLKLYECKVPFVFEFSQKKSTRINGLYYPKEQRIVINNKNFKETIEGDNLLFYTAMHELAHHIQFTERGHISGRSHTKLFWSILDDLAQAAEAAGLYRYDADAEVKKLIGEAEKISLQIAELQRELGTVLNKLHNVCLSKGVRYDDVLKRKVKLSARVGKKMVKISALNLDKNLSIGFETQEAIAAAGSIEEREAMLEAAAEGKSVNQVKTAAHTNRGGGENELETLTNERSRITRTIESLKKRLNNVIKRIDALSKGSPEGG